MIHMEFTSAETISDLKFTLSLMYSELETKFRLEKKILLHVLEKTVICGNNINTFYLFPSDREMDKIVESCITFFKEVISSLCFGPASAPEDELMENLLGTVFTTSETSDSTVTCNLTPFMSCSKDEVPVIRSFLLQLLLRHRYNIIKKKYINLSLKKFFCMKI